VLWYRGRVGGVAPAWMVRGTGRIGTIMTDCTCLSDGPRNPDVIDKRYIGCDETSGRFADVTLLRCSRCRRLWLRYAVEYEAFSRSGRWAEAPIGEKEAETMTPEAAAAFFDHAEFYIYGGSRYGHSGRRGSGPLQWGI
jgi:hypothetical protein